MKHRISSFSLSHYLHTLTTLLGKPRQFFQDALLQESLGSGLGFLLLSALLYTAATLAVNPGIQNPAAMAILLANGVGMAVIAAVIGYGIMIMMIGRKISFPLFLNIYAFSSGAALLAAWIPFFLIITEPWRWWLIGTGLVRAGKISKRHTMAIIILSITVITIFFCSALPVLQALGESGIA